LKNSNLSYLAQIRAKILSDLPQARAIEIRYKDDEKFRIIHPHIAYEAGTENILIGAFQMANQNKADQTQGWRDFAITDITDVIFTEDNFEPHPEFDPEANRYYAAISTI
jgi:hypothetical protein